MTYDAIPPLLPPDQMPAVRSAADLHRTWRALVGPPRFRHRQLWLLFLDVEGRPRGPLVSVDDLPDGPYDLAVDDLVELCRDLLDGPGGEGSVAMLIARPGPDRWHVGDRAWARFLTTAARRAGDPVWPVHRASDRGVEAVSGDGADAGADA